MPGDADDAAPAAAAGAASTSPPNAATPLNAAAEVGATLSKDVHRVEWNGQVSDNSFHLFVNETREPLELSWGDQLHDTHHGTVAPRANVFVGTYNFHTWRVRSKSRGLITTYTGPSVIVTVTKDGFTTQQNTTSHTGAAQRQGAAAAGAAAAGTGAAAGAGAGGGASSAEPDYRERSSVLGMPIFAFDRVSDAAVSRVEAVIGSMLSHSPRHLLERLVEGEASFAVFGLDQVVSDVPAHRFMRYNTGRDLDKSARGLGATPTVPVTSSGEENLTMEGDRWYPCQSILIHEMGHMVHNMGLPAGPEGVEGVLEAYRAALKARLYPKGCYMMTNEQEYWAVAVESWFESTVRDDVNGGIRTRAALRKHDPKLAKLLALAFGDGEWRYWQDCPKPLAMPSRGSAAARAAAAQPARAPIVAPSPPSWRARRPAKLDVVEPLDGGETSDAVRLLLRRLLCRRFLVLRRRRRNQLGSNQDVSGASQPPPLPPGAGPDLGSSPAAAAAAAPDHPYSPPPLPSLQRPRGRAAGQVPSGGRRRTAVLAQQEEVPPPLPMGMPMPMPPPLPEPLSSSSDYESDSAGSAPATNAANAAAAAAAAVVTAAAAGASAAAGGTADGTTAAFASR